MKSFGIHEGHEGTRSGFQSLFICVHRRASAVSRSMERGGMKKVVIVGERRAAVVEVADPEPKEDWVVVKVHAAPLCTEYKSFLARRAAEWLGHEAAGEVAAVAQPGRVRVGDRVVVMPQYPCGK